MPDHLEKLRNRLRAIDAKYEAAPRPRTDSVKRIAKIRSLNAVIAYLMAQPDYHRSDADQIYKMVEALVDVERGADVSWLSTNGAGSPPVRIRIRQKQDRLGEQQDQLISSGMSPIEAAREVLKTIPKDSSLLKGTKGNAKTVARWRYKNR